MTWQEAIAGLRRELRGKIEWAVNSIFVFTTVANTSALGDSDYVTLADDDSSKGQRPTRRIEPFGFRSRPVAKQRSLSIKLGSSTVFYLGIASDGGYGPGDLADGETALYCKAAGAEHRLDQDGNIKVTAASGKDVIVNGGTAKVGRVGDSVGGGKLAVAMGTGTFSGCVASVIYTDASGTVHTLTTGNLGPVNISEKITAGADHFKG